MKVKRVGQILYVIKYEECVTFYKTTLGLNILFQNKELACFDLYGTYLMIEKDDSVAYQNIKDDHKKIFGCIRVNVTHVKTMANELKSKNVEVDYQEHNWGTVAKFFDPDGNLLAFKDEESFEKQIKEYSLKRK